MNQSRLTMSFAGVAAMVALSLGAPASAVAADCGGEAKKVAKAIGANPESTLKVVAELVSASPKCSCEIVKAAISASKADKDMVVQIVTTAADAAPEEVASIINCAVQTSPESASLIAAKYGSVTAGAGKGVVPASSEPVGKGKVPVEPVKEEDFTWDFGLMQPGVGGIYLITPGGGIGYAPGQPRPGDKDGDGIPDAYDPNPNKPNNPNENTGGNRPTKPVRPPGPIS